MAAGKKTGIAQRMEGKVALVTGGASGIGRAIVERLVREGARAVVADLQLDAANALCTQLEAEGGHAHAIACDVSQESHVDSAIAFAMEKFGRLDILVNVAGISSPGRMTTSDMPLAEFSRVMSVNLNGTFMFISKALPIMVKQRYGRIVNMASTAAFMISDRTTPAYSSAKAAIAGLTRQVVFDYSKFGITSNSIAPGHIKTPLALRLGEEALNARIKRIPVGRLGEPEEIAAATAFLCSDEAGFITGQMLVVDGGQTTVVSYEQANS